MARLKIVLAMFAFGTLGPFIKNIPLPSSEIALYRGVIALLVLAVFLFASGRARKQAFAWRQLGILFLSGMAMGLNWVLLFEAYRHTSVALATLSYYFAPTAVVLGSALFFREALRPAQLICFAASTAGVVLIIGVSGARGGSDLVGVLFGLGAALLYASVVMGNKAAGSMDGVTRTLLQFLAAVLVLVPYVALTGGFHLDGLPGTGWAPLLIVGVVHTGIMYLLYFSAIPKVKGQQAAILSYIDPLVAVAISVFWLRETMSPLQWTGGVMILIFTLLNETVFAAAISPQNREPA
jgi:RarD protein